MTESARKILEDLTQRFRGVPILTLAQTALWDDPVKATFKALLDKQIPGARLILAVMDTDYFSRLPRPPAGTKPFDVVPHNDGTTQGLWAAVGEMSCLFGAETVPDCHTMASHGVQVHRALSATEDSEALDRLTMAWGWRGLAQTRGRRRLAGDVKLMECGQALRKQVEWALAETESIANRALGSFADILRIRIRDYVAGHPDACLADLYLSLLPEIYATLLGSQPGDLEYARSSDLMRFNRRTAVRLRFRPLDIFLNPGTASIARKHYNTAVHDSGIATLDRFGENAIPFDLAIPGRGRGTIHLHPSEIRVDTDDPIVIPLTSPVRNRRELAKTLEQELGEGIALIGKAVALIPMLAHEYVMLLNETGSGYVTNSCRWNRLLLEDGIGFQLYPILRLGVRPLDTIGSAGGCFRLPEHLAAAFGRERVSAESVQNGWREAVLSSRRELAEIRELRGSGAWLRREASRSESAQAEYDEYLNLRKQRRKNGIRIWALNQLSRRQLESLKEVRSQINEMEAEKGRHFRESILPKQSLGADAAVDSEYAKALRVRSEYETRIGRLRDCAGELLGNLAVISKRRKAIKSDSEIALREVRLAELAGKAELSRWRRVRDLWLVAEGLVHVQSRPTAWWFPCVDPTGQWYRGICDSAEYRWEPMNGETCTRAGEALEAIGILP